MTAPRARHARGRAVRGRPLRPRLPAGREPSGGGPAHRRPGRTSRHAVRTVVAALVAVAGGIAAGATAWALWQPVSSGAGADTATAPVVTVTTTSPGPVVPGTAVTVEVTVHNPGRRPFRLVALTLDPSAWPAACPATAWSLQPPDPLAGVPAGGERLVAVRLLLRADAPTGCQGATISTWIAAAGTWS